MNKQHRRYDPRLADAPLTSVQCEECAATVMVRKASWEQTTVQWDQKATATCLELPPAPRPEGAPTTFRNCSALAESIRTAAASGHLKLVDSRQVVTP